MQERIKACFTESIQTQIAAAEALPDAISRAAMTLVQSLLNGNKSSVVVMELPLPMHSICCQHDQPFRNGAAQLTCHCTKY